MEESNVGGVAMRIFVISLKDAVKRRASIVEQLSSMGLEFEFIDAIYGKELSKSEVEQLVDQRIAYRYEGYRLTPGEIGCALSHLAVYKRVVDEKIPYALIFEDDVAICPELAKVLVAIDADRSLIRYGITLFSECPILSSPSLKLPIGGMCLHNVKGGCFAHAYIITNEAARKLIELQTPVKHVADCWRWLLKHGLISIGAVRPVLTKQQRNYFGSETTVAHPDVSKLPILQFVKHKLVRCWWKLMDKMMLVESFG